MHNEKNQGAFMSAAIKLTTIGTIFATASVTFAADIPDSGRLLRESTPPPSVAPRQEPPKIHKPLEPKEQAPAGIKVKVSGFTFSGNSVFSSAELSALMSGYIGKELTLPELNAAVAEITAAYRAKGYFLASAILPPQTIKPDAPIIVEIIEGVLEGVRLEIKPAETRTPRSLLQRYVDRVPTGKPADEGSITDMLMRINEIPGISSRILLEPGSQKGTTKALLEATEGKGYSFSVDTDNHGGYATGYYRIGSTLELYSPLHMGDLFTLRAQTSFSGDTQTVQAGYSVPVSGSGTKVGFNYNFVTYQLGESFKTLDASGDAHDFLLTVTQPVVRSRNMILNFSLAGEGKLLNDRTGIASLKNQRHTASGQAGISGVEMDSWFGGGSTSFSANYIGGVVGIDDEVAKANDQSTDGLKTDGGYSRLAMSLFRNQNIYKNLSFYTGANGQWASSNLDSAEQFSLGGPGGVRAFPVSEASCDMGFVYTAELRYLIGSLGVVPGTLQLASFVDHGHAVLHETPVVPDNTRSLTGVGFGLTWFDADSFNIRSSVAWRTSGDATGKSEMDQPTVYFQAVKRF
jgi:hemolysin activation/secretion protein